MLTIGDKQYRNLQEQVLQNQSDIRYLLEEGGTLNQFGIRVVGVVETENDLPNPASYEGEYGDAYAVGTEPPYTLHIWTRQVSGQTGAFWFNIGQFPAPSTVPGPIGPRGIEGEPGIRGSFWYSQTGAPTNTIGVKNNDQALDGSNGDIYQFVNGVWQLTGNIRGPQGVPGIQGPAGATGATGPIGPSGPRGEQGQFISILGELTSTNQLPMVDTVPRYAAYLIPNSNNELHVWLIVGDGTAANPLRWYDAGGFGGGSNVTIDGNVEPSVEIGYLPKISVNYQIGEDTEVSTNGSEITISNLQTTGYNANNEKIEGMGTIELPIASTGEVEFSEKNNTLEANLAQETWQEIEEIISEAVPQEVQINAPTTSTNGQLTAEQLATLQANSGAYLMFNNEVYRLQDTQHISGYLVYSHLGYENTTQKYIIKCITITLSTRGWVLTSREVVNGSEYAKLTGGTFSGNIAVEQASYPQIALRNTGFGGNVRWEMNANGDVYFALRKGTEQKYVLTLPADAGYDTLATVNNSLQKSGGDMTGNIQISRGLNQNASVAFTRTDTGSNMFVGIGNGGINKGLWDENKQEWIVHSDGDKFYFGLRDILSEIDTLESNVKYTHYITITGTLTGLEWNVSLQLTTSSNEPIDTVQKIIDVLLQKNLRVICSGLRRNTNSESLVTLIQMYAISDSGTQALKVLTTENNDLSVPKQSLTVTDVIV